MRELLGGARMLGRGFAYWRRRPGLMTLGLVPAAISGALVVAAFVALSFALPGLAEAITPFADPWPAPWAELARIAAGAAIVVGALVLTVLTFTALTLFAGEPFYARIWAAVEADDGGMPAEARYGFWRALRDGISLVARGIGVALLSALLGLIPIAGGLLAACCAVTLTGWLLADELASRALTARGLPAAARRALLRRHRARVLGFGVVTQLCFLIPGGAIATMPAAVAGSTLLVRTLLAGAGRPDRRPAGAGHEAE